MKATSTILNLQELIRKTKCNTLINSGIIEIRADGTVVIRGKGVELLSTGKKGEIVSSKVDGSMSFSVTYPITATEPGEIPITDLTDFLSKTEMFSKENQVTLSITGNKLIINRELPPLNIEYDLADKKFITTSYKDMTDTVFGSPIVLINTKGDKKEILFTAEVVMDSAQLKAFADIASKMNVINIPLEVKDGKLLSILTGKGTKVSTELRTDICTGAASSKYGENLIEIFKAGFGLATIRFSNDSPIYVHYELNNIKTDYMLVKTNK
jgi:hypothetical protein